MKHQKKELKYCYFQLFLLLLYFEYLLFRQVNRKFKPYYFHFVQLESGLLKVSDKNL